MMVDTTMKCLSGQLYEVRVPLFGKLHDRQLLQAFLLTISIPKVYPGMDHGLNGVCWGLCDNYTADLNVLGGPT